jgi:hypothetical protein
LKSDVDGGLTLLIQNESPGKEQKGKWKQLPLQPEC